jgi:saccharopine dehydrogenase-like NADP-dependent oxidoreductase
MTIIAVLGAGQIGTAVFKIITDLKSAVTDSSLSAVESFVIDFDGEKLARLGKGSHVKADVGSMSTDDMFLLLSSAGATHVINALPFFMNERVAAAAVKARCHYIDFTEDDIMADSVQKMYEGTGLTCAVKCGLAPGFINYIGRDLVGKLSEPDTLMISVGALPRLVSYSDTRPEDSYNLTWSVDGLVNEYIRPCRIRRNGVKMEVPGLNNTHTVILDGTHYEAAMTSGGIGSLVDELSNVPNVHYMTLRYPGHYRYVKSVVQETHGNFDKIKSIFLKKFPTTDDDVIVVYAKATGLVNGALAVRSYSSKFYGVTGLTAIQSTTAGAGVAILEMVLNGDISGVVNHSSVDIEKFFNTAAFKTFYSPA